MVELFHNPNYDFGVITGTYSTICVAGALVVDWTLLTDRRRRLASNVEGTKAKAVKARDKR